MKRVAPILLVLLMIILATSNANSAEYTRESIDQIEKNLGTKRAVLVDVRENRETNEGFIDGAIIVPLSLLKEGGDSKEFAVVLAQRVPKESIVYTYCASGRRALGAATILSKIGYDARALKHGYSDLVKEGFVTAKPKK